MPAPGGPQFEQLSMFMSARDVESQLHPHDEERLTVDGTHFLENPDELYDRKYREASRPYDPGYAERHGSTSLVDDIRQHGVQDPISVVMQRNQFGKRQIVGGHHRIAVNLRHNPDALMPVMHFKDLDDADQSPFYT